jgi:hypothetical protein
MWPAVVASVLLSGLTPSLIPAAFGASRVTKVTLMSLAIPVTTYLAAIGFAA